MRPYFRWDRGTPPATVTYCLLSQSNDMYHPGVTQSFTDGQPLVSESMMPHEQRQNGGPAEV